MCSSPCCTHAETVLAHSGCGPLCGPVGTLPSSSSQEGVLGLSGCSLAGVKPHGRAVSLPHFLWQSCALASAILCSSHGNTEHKPSTSGNHVITRKQAKVEEAACPLPLSPSTCLHIFSLFPNWQIQIYQRGVGFIPICAPGWQGDLGHVPLSAMTHLPSSKMGSECDLWESS